MGRTSSLAVLALAMTAGLTIPAPIRERLPDPGPMPPVPPRRFDGESARIRFGATEISVKSLRFQDGPNVAWDDVEAWKRRHEVPKGKRKGTRRERKAARARVA